MKLNKKGYMLVEIVLASVLAMSIAYYLLNLTYKFNNKSQDIYQSINYTMEKNIITKNIMNDLEQGTINGIEEKENFIKFTLNLENKSIESRALLLENGKIIYGKYENNQFDKSDISYYEKEISNSVIMDDLTLRKNGSVIIITIPITSIYSDTKYDIKLMAKIIANKVIIRYNVNGGTYTGLNTTYTVDNDGWILANGVNFWWNYSYGSTFDIEKWDNSEHFFIEKEGTKAVEGAEWCTSSDGTGTCYSDTVKYNHNDLCNASTSNCIVDLYVNWQE